jgi:hypothetical protein
VNGYGPADATWAYQWDVIIPRNGTFQISKDKNLNARVIPEPASLVLVALAVGILFASRKR